MNVDAASKRLLLCVVQWLVNAAATPVIRVCHVRAATPVIKRVSACTRRVGLVRVMQYVGQNAFHPTAHKSFGGERHINRKPLCFCNKGGGGVMPGAMGVQWKTQNSVLLAVVDKV